MLEILVVIAIIGIMASTVVISLRDKADKARITKALTDIDGFDTALDVYLLDHSTFPASLSALEPKYVKRVPNDPWGNPYQIQRPGVHEEVDIFSFGSDGAMGGDGIAADIGNWQLR